MFAVLALTMVLAACYPTITIEAEGPSFEAGLRVQPVVSGVLLIVQVPTPHPRTSIEVVATEGPTFHIPPGHFPPPGSCRIWFPERPPGRQPPPGDCGVLERQVPRGAYLVYG